MHSFLFINWKTGKEQNTNIVGNFNAPFCCYCFQNSNMPYHYVYLYLKSTEMYPRIVFFKCRIHIPMSAQYRHPYPYPCCIVIIYQLNYQKMALDKMVTLSFDMYSTQPWNHVKKTTLLCILQYKFIRNIKHKSKALEATYVISSARASLST